MYCYNNSLGIDLSSFSLNPNKKEDIPVTVCVALLSDNRRNVVGVADRMITAGDIEYEPPQQKVIPLTNSIVVMTAGDSSFNTEIINEVKEFVSVQLQSDPDTWLRVADVAKKFQEAMAFLSAQKAAVSRLTPYGLDLETFISRQSEFAPEFLDNLTAELMNFAVPTVEAIITGVDSGGGHIFVVDNEELMCLDHLGFACIGIGQEHSSSQLMFDCYAPDAKFPIAMFEGYTAKKRAEVAPGVGEATDMFAVVGLGAYSEIADHVKEELERQYQNIRKSEIEVKSRTKEAWEEYVKERVQKQQQKTVSEQVPTEAAGNGDAPDNTEKV